jgi:hypothetical protein
MDWPDCLYRHLAQTVEGSLEEHELLKLAVICEEVANDLEDRRLGGCAQTQQVGRAPGPTVRCCASPIGLRTRKIVRSPRSGRLITSSMPFNRMGRRCRAPPRLRPSVRSPCSPHEISQQTLAWAKAQLESSARWAGWANSDSPAEARGRYSTAASGPTSRINFIF